MFKIAITISMLTLSTLMCFAEANANTYACIADQASAIRAPSDHLRDLLREGYRPSDQFSKNDVSNNADQIHDRSPESSRRSAM